MATPSSDDDAPLLGQTESVNAEPWGKNVHSRYYTLPFCRFTNIVKIILIMDVISSLAFWITGGNTKYFVDNILHFHFLQSTFDLALLASVRVVLLFLFYDLLEHYTFLQIDAPYEPKLSRKKSGCHAAVILVPLLCLGFAATKGGLILNAILNDKNYDHMHLTYNILVISTVVFIFLELCLGLGSFIAMRRFKKQRVLHRLNIMGQEIDDDGKPMKKNVDIIRLAKLAGPEACLIASGTFCLLVSTASDTAAPYYFGMVVDAALHSMDKLNHTILILFGIYAAGALSSSLRAFLFTLAGQRLVARLRKNIFNCIIAQEVAFFDVTRTGELTNRLSSDTQVLQNAVTVNVSMLSRYVLQIIGSLVLMFGLNASLTGVMLAVVPVIALGAVQYGAYMKKIQQQFQDCLADASTTAEETISSMRTVRSFCGEKKAGKAYGKDIDRSYSAGKKLAIGSGLFYGVVSFLINGAIALVLWYGGKLVHDKALTPGVLTSFLLYTIQVAMAFGLITSLYGDFMRAVGASLRIFDLLDRKPEVPNEGGAMMSSMKGGVEFQHVYFTYPSRPDNKVLRDVSFKVEPGQVVALVGPSGGGKSTIVNLIERFYDPEEGKISLNGCELQGLDPQWFRKQIAMVSQEPVLFACSIKDNIMYGRDATMEQVIDAAKQANAHNFITTFEEGYETLVGERGVRLSGGQKQRVAIARALIMNPSVLLLDEATSALDAESEHLVQEAIDRAMRNRTVLVIAHRLSTVRNADQVVVIDRGSVAEKGTHEELLESDGVYKRLVLRQLTAGGSGKTEDDEQAPSSVMLPTGGDDKLLVA